MAKTTDIPDTDNLLRYVRKRQIAWDLDTNTPLHFFPDMFRLKEKEEALSMNWVEFWEGVNQNQKIRRTAEDFSASYRVKKDDAFSKLNVGEFMKVCKDHCNPCRVRIVHDAVLKKSAIKSHVSVIRLPQDNARLLEDLCELAFVGYMPANSVLTFARKLTT